MEERLLKQINYESEWKRTLLYKITFGKKKPSEAWKRQLDRLYNRKYKDINLISTRIS